MGEIPIPQMPMKLLLAITAIAICCWGPYPGQQTQQPVPVLHR